jgi:hypothetical protein
MQAKEAYVAFLKHENKIESQNMSLTSGVGKIG